MDFNEQKPVECGTCKGKLCIGEGTKDDPIRSCPNCNPKAQQRKPLTDEEIVAINDEHYNIAYRDFDADIAIARAIEAAHGIKE